LRLNVIHINFWQTWCNLRNLSSAGSKYYELIP